MGFKFDEKTSVRTCKEYGCGLSSLEISKVFGTSTATIRSLLRRHNVTLRNYIETYQNYECSHFSFTGVTGDFC